jgi:hypothetical protein
MGAYWILQDWWKARERGEVQATIDPKNPDGMGILAGRVEGGQYMANADPWPDGVWPPWEGRHPMEEWIDKGFEVDDDGHVLVGTDGYTRAQAIAQFPPIQVPTDPYPDFTSPPHGSIGERENDGSPPLGHPIPGLEAISNYFGPGYVLSAGAFDNYSEFQQQHILHSFRYRLAGPYTKILNEDGDIVQDPRWQDPVFFKENFGMIHGHQRAADGTPSGYPGGFLTWPDYEQDLWVAQGGIRPYELSVWSSLWKHGQPGGHPLDPYLM